MLSSAMAKLLASEVHRVTEWRDGAVYRTTKIGEVVAMSNALPFKPDAGVVLVSKS